MSLERDLQVLAGRRLLLATIAVLAVIRALLAATDESTLVLLALTTVDLALMVSLGRLLVHLSARAEDALERSSLISIPIAGLAICGISLGRHIAVLVNAVRTG